MENNISPNTITKKSPLTGMLLIGFVALVFGAIAMYFGKDMVLSDKAPEVIITQGLVRECSVLAEDLPLQEDGESNEVWYSLAKTENYQLVVSENPYENIHGNPCSIEYAGVVYLYNTLTKRNYSLTGQVALTSPVYLQEINENYLVLEGFSLEASEFYIISLLTQEVVKAPVLKAPHGTPGGQVLAYGNDSIIFEKRSGPERPWGSGENNAASVSNLNLERLGVSDLSEADALHDYHLLGFSADLDQVYIEEVAVKNKKAWENIVEKAEFNVLSVSVN